MPGTRRGEETRSRRERVTGERLPGGAGGGPRRLHPEGQARRGPAQPADNGL